MKFSQETNSIALFMDVRTGKANIKKLRELGIFLKSPKKLFFPPISCNNLATYVRAPSIVCSHPKNGFYCVEE